MKTIPCIFLVIFGSCSFSEIKDPSPAVNAIKANKKYRINLPEDHRNGFTWQLKDDYNKKLIEQLSTVWHGNEKGVDYNFKTLSSGSTTLTFISRKYTDTAEIKQYFVEIE